MSELWGIIEKWLNCTMIKLLRDFIPEVRSSEWGLNKE
jgi:hypothetical protein